MGSCDRSVYDCLGTRPAFSGGLPPWSLLCPWLPLHIWPVLGAAGHVSGLDMHLLGTAEAGWLLCELLHMRCPSYTLCREASVSVACPVLVGLSVDAQYGVWGASLLFEARVVRSL